MKIYAFVDSREIDRFANIYTFAHREDAEAMRDSMKNDKDFFDIHEIELIKGELK